MFSLICVWTHGWANNQDTGDLRFRRTHYDASVMKFERTHKKQQKTNVQDCEDLFAISVITRHDCINCTEVISSYHTVYPKKYAHGFRFAVLCCGYTLTDFPISTRLTSLALWQSNDCPSASKATLMNMDKYFMWIHYERLHNHNKAKHNKTVCIFLGIYCTPEHYSNTN